jgi:hypothetical protein
MPIHVERMESEVAVFDGELPLSEAQLRKLVAMVGRRLEERKLAPSRRELPRRSVLPPLETRG